MDSCYQVSCTSPEWGTELKRRFVKLSSGVVVVQLLRRLLLLQPLIPFPLQLQRPRRWLVPLLQRLLLLDLREYKADQRLIRLSLLLLRVSWGLVSPPLKHAELEEEEEKKKPTN
jgi:hypothetical protein